MAARLPLSLRTRTCLYQFTPQTARRQLQDPLTRWSKSGGVERRRYLASVAQAIEVDDSLWQRPQSIGYIPEDSDLGCLLASIRRQDAAGTSRAFFAWAENLANTESPSHHDAVQQLENLPSPVLSEIFRSIDPVSHPELDVVYGLNITQGQTQFTDAGKLFDDFGARLHHRRVLRGVKAILKHRNQRSRFPLRVADFEVFLRVSGAASDYVTAPFMLSGLKPHNLDNARTNKTWVEFLKARFMTSPTYYQYDRNRVIVDPQNLITVDEVWNRSRDELAEHSEAKVRYLDNLRYSENALKRQPWNRNRQNPKIDQRRLLRRWGTSDYRSFWNHWVKTHRKSQGQGMDVELLSISIEGFSRSNDHMAILEHVLSTYYGVVIDEETQAITGGYDLPESSPLYPTDRLLFALVESFGAMSQISLGMQLIDYISRKYAVSISPQTWSNLLHWTYTAASKMIRSKRRAYGDEEKTYVCTHDVIQVWDIMTAPPYNVKPSFDDLDIYIRTLIISRRFKDAIQLISESAMPFYQSVTEEYETSVIDEILLKDVVHDTLTPTSTAALSTAGHRRHQAEAQKDFVFNRICFWFQDLLSKASSSAAHRKGDFMTVVVPDLVREYPSFFVRDVRYRTISGEVRFKWSSESAPFRWEEEVRRVLPQKRSSVDVSTFHTDKNGQPRKIQDPETGAWVENQDFEWPVNRDMLIREKRRIPKSRAAELSRPPSPIADAEPVQKWWRRLERELMH